MMGNSVTWEQFDQRDDKDRGRGYDTAHLNPESYYNCENVEQVHQMDKDTMAAYERYVLASFRYPNDAKAQEAERLSAIDSLVPGTVNYYHLKLTHIQKTKRTFLDLDKNELALFDEFRKKFHFNQLFHEVECNFHMNRLDSITLEDLKSPDSKAHFTGLMKILTENIFYSEKYPKQGNRPSHMEDTSEMQAEEGEVKVEQRQEVDVIKNANLFDRDALKKQAQNLLDSNKSDDKRIIPYFIDELDWSSSSTKTVRQLLEQICHGRDGHRIALAEVTNQTILDKIVDIVIENCENHLKWKKAIKLDYNERKKQMLHYIRKDRFPNHIFGGCTLKQLEYIGEKVKAKGHDISDSGSAYQIAFFSKYFADELSEDYNESRTNEEKYKILSTLYSYAKTKKLKKGLRYQLLHQMLELGIKTGDYNEELFKEYLEWPQEVHGHWNASSYAQNAYSRYLKWRGCLEGIIVKRPANYINTHLDSVITDYHGSRGLISKYLMHFCMKNGGVLANYKKFFNPDYLKGIELKCRVYLSETGVKDLEKIASPIQLKLILDQIFLRFTENNKENFEVDETVKLTVELKNVQKLTIRVFEFNTETYYKKYLKPFDTSIDLQGLEPMGTRVETDMFKDVPKNRVLTKTFDFDELTGKSGLFIIELMGNGLMSRAVIKKGHMTFVHRPTIAGHTGYLLDHKQNILMGDKTGIWLDKKFYPAKESNKGIIFIPFNKDYAKTETVIMIHEGFSQLSEFHRASESYEFDLNYHMNSESILMGQEASILLRPKLSINGRRIQTKLLKQCAANLRVDDILGQTTKLRFDNLKFDNKEECILKFQVPVNTKSIELEVTAKIHNATDKVTQSLSSGRKTIDISEHSNDDKLRELYLRRVNDEYFIYSLGKNGESSQGIGSSIAKNVDVTLYHEYYDCQTYSATLQLDKDGKVGLGKLIGYRQIDVRQSMQDGTHSESWHINGQGQQTWTQVSEMHIIEGENIELPVSLPTDPKNPQQGPSKNQVNRSNLSCIRYNNHYAIENLYDKIKIVPSAKGLYHILKLESLGAGNYQIEIRFTQCHYQKINLTVHRGKYWKEDESFIIKNNCLLTKAKQDSGLTFEDVNVSHAEESKSQDAAETKLQVQLGNFSEGARVHVFGMQFMPNDCESLFNELESFAVDSQIQQQFNMTKWTNTVDNEQRIGDEIQYVLARRQRENQMGNMLDRPSLLMKRQYVRDTTTDDENLKAGTDFAKRDLASAEIGTAYARKMADKAMRNYHVGVTTKYKDFANFLSCAPLQLFNLKADKNGVVNVNLRDLQNYCQVFLVGCDEQSVVQMSYSTQQLMTMAGVKVQGAIPAIPRRDLSQNRDLKDADRKGLIESRDALCLLPGSRVHIEDVTSSKIQIIDDIRKLSSIVEFTHNHWRGQQNELESEARTLVEEVLLKWPLMERETKLAEYQKHVSHELNFFLATRDPEFFAEVALPFVGGKLEKTFIDQYLLSKSHNKYLTKVLSLLEDDTIWDKLNFFETCLLLEVCIKRGSEAQASRGKIIALNLIRQLKAETSTFEESQSYIDQGIKVFEMILNSSDLDGGNKNLAQQIEEASMVSEQSQLEEQKCYDYCDDFDDCDDDEDESDEEPPQIMMKSKKEFKQSESKGVMKKRMKSRAVARDIDCFRAPPAINAACEMMAMDACFDEEEDDDMRECFGGDSYGEERAAPMRAARNKSGGRRAAFDDDYGSELNEAIAEERNKAANKFAFEKLDKTAEYVETHYYMLVEGGVQTNRYDQRQNLFARKLFYTDYLQYLVDDGFKKNKPFLSAQYNGFGYRDLIVAFGWLDLPIDKPVSKSSYKIKSDGKRGIYIAPENNMNSIIFKREIKEGTYKPRSDLMIIHRYSAVKKISSDDEDLDEFIINNPYRCEVIMTNVSSKQKQMTVLFQIPNGALPLRKTKYMESKTVTIGPYSTEKQEMLFYFPNDGEFQHYPTNLAELTNVISISPVRTLKVGMKRKIKTVDTFIDMMFLAGSIANKKAKILELMDNNLLQMMMPKFKFRIDHLFSYFYDDHDFTIEFAMRCFDNSVESMLTPMRKYVIHEFLQFCRKIPHKDMPKEKLAKRLTLYKHCIAREPVGNIVKSFFRVPRDNLLFKMTWQDITDFTQEFKHREYFPIVNQRVFSLDDDDKREESKDEKKGGSDAQVFSSFKRILNVQFRQTYQRFLYLNLFVPFKDKSGKLDVPEKYKLQLVYYLQLQDRVDEAIRVFNSIDLSNIQESQEGEIDATCQMAYDYMAAYLDFYSTGNDYGEAVPMSQKFKKAREVVAKYPVVYVPQFKVPFQKLANQLRELDEQVAQPVKMFDANGDAEMTEEQKEAAKQLSRKKSPLILTVEVDDKGTLTVHTDNIQELSVRFYLIDSEILFSRQPFLASKAEQFSFVKPYVTVNQKTNASALANNMGFASAETKVALPESLQGKDVCIEISSNEQQKFMTYFSCGLNVQFNEEFGELRVFNKSNNAMMSRVYVKVFYKETGTGQEKFWRDGFTDIRGRFEYANASGKDLNSVEKFAVFLDDPKLGSMIKEVNKPTMQI